MENNNLSSTAASPLDVLKAVKINLAAFILAKCLEASNPKPVLAPTTNAI
jgi:hypothetical protein